MKRIELVVGEKIPLTAGGFSELVYLGEAGKSKARTQRKVLVKCPCGVEFESQLGIIRNSHIKGCKKCGYEVVGQKMQKDLVGQKFNRLTVLECDGRYRGRLTYKCLCDCGNTIEHIDGRRISAGNVKSCGCLRKEVVSALKGTNWEPGTIIGDFEILGKADSTKCGKQRYIARNMRTGNQVLAHQGNIRLLSTDLGRITYLIRKRVRNALEAKGLRKTQSTIKGLPWSTEDILRVIGPRPEGDYHLEHRCPLSQAKTEEEIIALNNPINLCWLSSTENLSKGDSWTEEGARLCKELLGREWEDPSE